MILPEFGRTNDVFEWVCCKNVFNVARLTLVAKEHASQEIRLGSLTLFLLVRVGSGYETRGQFYYPQRVNGQQNIFIEQQGTSNKF